MQYQKDGITYAIRNNKAMDSITPFWVYYNHKLASKFDSLKMAKDYIKVLMR